MSVERDLPKENSFYQWLVDDIAVTAILDLSAQCDSGSYGGQGRRRSSLQVVEQSALLCVRWFGINSNQAQINLGPHQTMPSPCLTSGLLP